MRREEDKSAESSKLSVKNIRQPEKEVLDLVNNQFISRPTTPSFD